MIQKSTPTFNYDFEGMRVDTHVCAEDAQQVCVP